MFKTVQVLGTLFNRGTKAYVLFNMTLNKWSKISHKGGEYWGSYIDHLIRITEVHNNDASIVWKSKLMTSRVYLIDRCSDDSPEWAEDKPDGGWDEREADEVDVVVDGILGSISSFYEQLLRQYSCNKNYIAKLQL